MKGTNAKFLTSLSNISCCKLGRSAAHGHDSSLTALSFITSEIQTNVSLPDKSVSLNETVNIIAGSFRGVVSRA